MASQSNPLFALLDKSLRDTPGHLLFTILLLDEGRGTNRRLYSSAPDAYPVGGEKPLRREAELYRLLVEQGVPRRCEGRDAIVAAFADHALILSLECESALNVPVRWQGHTVGALNLLHRAGHYAGLDLSELSALADATAPLLLMQP